MTILDKILGGILAATLAALAVLLVMNANLRADVATLRANASTLGIANAELKEKAESQNRAIVLLQSDGENRARAAQQAVKAAAAQATKYRNEAVHIEKAQPAGSDCSAATQILRNYLANAISVSN